MTSPRPSEIRAACRGRRSSRRPCHRQDGPSRMLSPRELHRRGPVPVMRGRVAVQRRRSAHASRRRSIADQCRSVKAQGGDGRARRPFTPRRLFTAVNLNCAAGGRLVGEDAGCVGCSRNPRRHRHPRRQLRPHRISRHLARAVQLGDQVHEAQEYRRPRVDLRRGRRQPRARRAPARGRVSLQDEIAPLLRAGRVEFGADCCSSPLHAARQRRRAPVRRSQAQHRKWKKLLVTVP